MTMSFRLGWELSISRKRDDRTEPADFDSESGTVVARWGAEVDGLRWLADLCEVGDARSLGGGGYPSVYTVVASAMLPILESGGPPGVRIGRQVSISPGAVADIAADEWLMVTAFDTS